jgi:hypothetical protein
LQIHRREIGRFRLYGSANRDVRLCDSIRRGPFGAPEAEIGRSQGRTTAADAKYRDDKRAISQAGNHRTPLVKAFCHLFQL